MPDNTDTLDVPMPESANRKWLRLLPWILNILAKILIKIYQGTIKSPLGLFKR